MAKLSTLRPSFLRPTWLQTSGLGTWAASLFSWLGNVDTTCAIFGADPGACGARPLMGWFFEQPWVAPVLAIAGLIMYLEGFRRGIVRDASKAASDLEGQWAPRREAVDGFDARLANLERKMDAIVKALAKIEGHLGELAASSSGHGQAIERLQHSVSGLNQEVLNNKKVAEDGNRDTYEGVSRHLVTPLEERLTRLEEDR